MAAATRVTLSPSTVRQTKPQRDEALSLGPKELRAPQQHTQTAAHSWGRHNSPNGLTILSTISIMLFCPILVMIFHLACASYQGSLFSLGEHFLSAPSTVFRELFPPLSSRGLLIGVSWTVLQVLLWFAVPSPKSSGSRTPAGNLLQYPMNGLRIFAINHLLFALGVASGFFKGSIFYDHRGDLIALANIYGVLLATFCFVKAHLLPSHPEDRKFSGSIIYGA